MSNETKPKGRTVQVVAICMPPVLLRKAKARAKQEKRSLSAHLALLAEKDLKSA